MKEKDWKEEIREHSTYVANTRELLINTTQVIKIIEFHLKSNKEELQKAIEQMPGYITNITKIDHSSGEIKHPDMDSLKHEQAQILLRNDVKQIITNILK